MVERGESCDSPASSFNFDGCLNGLVPVGHNHRSGFETEDLRGSSGSPTSPVNGVETIGRARALSSLHHSFDGLPSTLKVDLRLSGELSLPRSSRLELRACALCSTTSPSLLSRPAFGHSLAPRPTDGEQDRGAPASSVVPSILRTPVAIVEQGLVPFFHGRNDEIQPSLLTLTGGAHASPSVQQLRLAWRKGMRSSLLPSTCVLTVLNCRCGR